LITPIGQADPRRSFMRGTLIRSVVLIGVTAGAALVALLLFSDHADLVLRLALGAGGLLVALTALSRFSTYLYDDSDVRPARRSAPVAPEWPAELLEIEGRVSLAKVSAFDHRSRLRPLLRELATQRLDASRHLDIERQPEEARRILGPELWEEVQSSPASKDLRDSPGPTNATILRLVEKIESL